MSWKWLAAIVVGGAAVGGIVLWSRRASASTGAAAAYAGLAADFSAAGKREIPDSVRAPADPPVVVQPDNRGGADFSLTDCASAIYGAGAAAYSGKVSADLGACASPGQIGEVVHSGITGVTSGAQSLFDIDSNDRATDRFGLWATGVKRYCGDGAYQAFHVMLAGREDYYAGNLSNTAWMVQAQKFQERATTERCSPCGKALRDALRKFLGSDIPEPC